MKTTLVDADILLYSCGFAAEESVYETEDGEVHATPTQAKKWIEAEGISSEIIKRTEAEAVSHPLRLAKNLLLRVKEATDADELRLFLTGSKNFRVDIATIKPYKGNRPDSKPLHYQAIKDYLIGKWGAEVTTGYEADDALGIHQTDDTCIASIDKDLNCIPGEHYNWNHDKLYHVDEIEATRNFYHQLLTGDSTDNIQGIPGVGEKGAIKKLKGLVSEEDLYWRALHEYTYCNKYDKPYDAMVENGKLLYIMREDGKQWEPKY